MYEDWQVKPWTTNFMVARVLTGQRGSGYGYTVFVGEWVDAWWGKFWASWHLAQRS